jgi:hypothetical protein
MKKHWWKWVCEMCFKKTNRKILPVGWDLIWQSAICPACLVKLSKIPNWQATVPGGYFSKGKKDPRAK